jgi:hypothetical protein
VKKAIGSISPATVIASIALFVSLGGVAYGVAAGSIDSREIKNGTVQSRDVRDGALRGRDVANGSIHSRDLRDGAVRGIDINDRSLGGSDLADNTLGDREINEPALDVQRLGGIDAARYVKNVRRVQSATANDPATPKTAPPVNCPKGKRVLGGGARIVAPAGTPVALSANFPSGNGWQASAYATAATGNWQLLAFAICG